MSARKFAIAGDLGQTVLFWTGRASNWAVMERAAKTWTTRERAEAWLPKVTKGRAMDNLRVIPVAA